MRPLLVLAPLLHLVAGCYQAHELTRDASPDAIVEDPLPDVGDEPAHDVGEVEVEDVVEEEISPVDDCTVDLATFVPGAERAGISTVEPVWTVQGAFTPGFDSDPFSFLDIESWYADGGPTEPGTYEITERVSTYTCGLCLFVCEGCPLTANHCRECDHTYAATRGTVQLDEISASLGGTVRGSLVDAYLAEVEWSADTLVPDGRGVCVDMWSFDEVITDYEDW